METLYIIILYTLTTDNVLPMWLNIILKLMRKAKNKEVVQGIFNNKCIQVEENK